MNVSQILSTLAVMGLKTLRETVVLPRIVNRDYEQEMVGMKKNGTVNVTVPAAVETKPVTPGAVPPNTDTVTPTTVPVQLTEHEEAAFFLSDSDLMKVQQGIIPMQADEAARSLANRIDTWLFSKYKSFYGFAGTAGSTPFANDLAAYLRARKLGNDQLMPKEPRFMLLDSDAEANALGLRAFQDASFTGSQDVIVNGQIGRKLGALWLAASNIPTHTTQAAGSPLIDQVDVEVGDTNVHFDGFTTKPSVGDCFTVAGDDQDYVVDAASDLAGTDTDVSFYPPARVAWANDAEVTFRASHTVNLLIHRDAIAFAMAPLVEANIAPDLAKMVPIIDEASGLALRVELTREHKRWRWSYDAMWGGSVVRRGLGIRLGG